MTAVYYHPFFVHFVIALFLFSVVMDWIGLWRQSDYFIKSGWYALNGCIFFLVFSIISGLASRSAPHVSLFSPDLLDLHFNFAFLSSLGIVLLYLIRISQRGQIPQPKKRLFILLQLLSVIFVLLTAHYGGALIFHLILK